MAGDANIAGKVDVADLGARATSYGVSTGGTWGQGDFEYNGNVGVGDLGMLATNYGVSIAAGAVDASSTIAPVVVATPAAAVAVPEPIGGAFLLVSAMVISWRRQRRSLFGR
ncbi:MAG TPA: hypothetical protein VLI90_11790 [Tepidisphaeraceae bacterium]|nr:hypothetical protein [Tepidisphaeraceae bacterium]